VALGRLEARHGRCAPLAGKSTLNRLEHGAPEADRYRRIAHDGAAIEALFVELFLDAQDRAPKEIVLDLDATDDPLHGHQEGRFFHGYYDCHCYLPLYVFCGRHLLAAKLRRSNIDASAGAVEEVARIIGQNRARWPRVRIVLRGDGGFARDVLMSWCEANRVDYLFGLARNPRPAGASTSNSPGLSTMPKPPADPHAASPTSAGPRATAGAAAGASSPRRRGCPAAAPGVPIPASSSPRSSPTGRMPARSTRGCIAPAARWRTGSRSASSISSPTARAPLPCAPTSSGCGSPRWPTCWSPALRRIGLAGTELATATCGSIRLKLLKIGAPVTRSVRRIRVAMASSCPDAAAFRLAHARLCR
jgi:Transposase DDE domain group 1